MTIGTRTVVPRHFVQAVGRAAMRAAGCPPRAEIEVALVDDATIARLNRQFLGHIGPTDVLTFANGRGRGASLLGEVVVSIPRARAQARQLHHSVRREVALLLAHGVLHLRGYCDDTPRRAARMLARAEAIVDGAVSTKTRQRARGKDR